eukprot:1146274-Heterocapsa_arctica.AAC.1
MTATPGMVTPTVPLPPNWATYTSGGLLYYANAVTFESRWDPPPTAATSPPMMIHGPQQHFQLPPPGGSFGNQPAYVNQPNGVQECFLAAIRQAYEEGLQPTVHGVLVNWMRYWRCELCEM